MKVNIILKSSCPIIRVMHLTERSFENQRATVAVATYSSKRIVKGPGCHLFVGVTFNRAYMVFKQKEPLGSEIFEKKASSKPSTISHTENGVNTLEILFSL